MQVSTVTALTGKLELLAASGDDPYVRYDVRDEVPVRGWSRAGAVAWVAPDAWHRDRAALNAVGPVPEAAELVGHMITSGAVEPLPCRLPRGAMPLLPDSVRPPKWVDWDWWWSQTPPPTQANEIAVSWLDDDDHDDITALLELSSPTASASVADEHTLRWCGVRDDSGALIACCADVRYLPNVPHLASIATRPDQRGRGLGAAVTAWISRRCFDEGLGVVTFGMYAHNETARRMYRRLGFTDLHHWSSARLTC
ncbi:MAG: GNAT family N-acetyltransferase [Candidatus Nanopelagicales bacterium]